MALLFLDSFDHYDTAHNTAKWTESYPNAGAMEIVAGQGRCGTAAMRLGVNCRATKGIAVTGTPTVGACGFALKALDNSLDVPLCNVVDPAGQVLLQLVYADTGAFQLAGVWSVADLLHVNTWGFVEVAWTIHPTAGTARFRLNGIEYLTLTGVNTGSGAWGGLQLLGGGFARPATKLFDDLYVLDDATPGPTTFLGDVRVEYLRPQRAGSAQAWALTGAASHWAAVDDGATPDDDTSYLSSSTVGAQDLQGYAPTGLPSGTILGAQVNLLMRKAEAGPRQVATVVRSGGLTAVGVNQAPSYSPTYRYLSQAYGLNPTTGGPWTPASINGAEFGVAVTG